MKTTPEVFLYYIRGPPVKHEIPTTEGLGVGPKFDPTPALGG